MIRRRIVFKVKEAVIIEDPRDLTLTEIEHLKLFVAGQMACKYDEVDVEILEEKYELSNIDFTNEGMFNWNCPSAKILTGLKLNLVEGSDDHLDAIANGTLENFLEFN